MESSPLADAPVIPPVAQQPDVPRLRRMYATSADVPEIPLAQQPDAHEGCRGVHSAEFEACAHQSTEIYLGSMLSPPSLPAWAPATAPAFVLHRLSSHPPP